jgi:E3 ubiquitin-protein ligase RGLG
MGGFGSKESSSGRQQQQQQHNQDRGRSAAPAGHNRFAKFGDDYHTLEQVSQTNPSVSLFVKSCIAA